MSVVLPFVPGQHLAVRADVVAGKIADGAMEPLVRKRQPERHAASLDVTVPPIDARLHLADVVVTQPFVERGERRHRLVDDVARPTTSPTS